MPDPLQNLLEDVCDNVEDAHNTLQRAGGVLSDDDVELVTEHIEVALERIEHVLSELGGVGDDADCAAFESLEGVAQECVNTAKRALASHETGSATPDRIGGAMKSIRRMITATPDGLRFRAGL